MNAVCSPSGSGDEPIRPVTRSRGFDGRRVRTRSRQASQPVQLLSSLTTDDGVCVVRYDDEVGKGDHRHFRDRESAYPFAMPEARLAAFERDIARWNRENSDSRDSRIQ